MKDIKEILVLVKEEFNNPMLLGEEEYYYNCLCDVITLLRKNNIISDEELFLFDDYWDNYSKTHKVFYGINDEKILSKDRDSSNSYYGWPEGLKKGRNRWLNKHIKIN